MVRRGAAVAAVTSLVSFSAATAAFALCVAASGAEHFARATIVFEGTAQPGEAQHRTLLSPASFQVERYLKGEGPASVQVTTAVWDAGDGIYMAVSSGIDPLAGERWRIFASEETGGVWATSACQGSRRVEAAAATPDTGEPAAAPDVDLVRSEDRSPWVPLLLAVLVLALGIVGTRVWRDNDVPRYDTWAARWSWTEPGWVCVYYEDGESAEEIDLGLFP